MTFHGGYLSVDDVLSKCSDRREDCINPHKNPSLLLSDILNLCPASIFSTYCQIQA